jgi:hypothetical protein
MSLVVRSKLPVHHLPQAAFPEPLLGQLQVAQFFVGIVA